MSGFVGGSGGGNTPVAAEIVTEAAVYTLTDADHRKTFINQGATSWTVIDASGGLSDGFELTLANLVGSSNAASMVFVPESTDGVMYTARVTGPAGGALIIDAVSNRSDVWALKKVGTNWIYTNRNNGAAGDMIGAQTQIANLAAVNGIGSLASILGDGDQTSTGFTFTVKAADDDTSLGTRPAGTDTYSDGSDLGGLETIYLEIANTDGSNAFKWGTALGIGQTVAIAGASAGETNYLFDASSHNYYPWVRGPGLTIPAGETWTFWLSSASINGHMFLRNQNGGAVTAFADALKNNPI